MEHRREKYIAGYCIAMLTVAVIGIRTDDALRQGSEAVWRAETESMAGGHSAGEKKRLPDAQDSGEAGQTQDMQDSGKAGQARDSGEAGNISESAGMSGSKVPAYQKMYPDMYAEQVSAPTSAGAKEEEIRRIFMTFDDGPSENTEEVVEALNEAGAKAAFFLIGDQITGEREELVRQMAADGHILGVHTYSHNYKDIYSSVESFLTDFHKTYERIYEVTGEKPVYFRFPWGSVNCYNKKIRQELIAEMERRGFQYFDWNVSAEDSVGKPTEYSVLHNVTDNFSKFRNAVVLMHDGSNNKISAKMLPKILAAAKEKDYEFGKIDELPKPYHWPNSY